MRSDTCLLYTSSEVTAIHPQGSGYRLDTATGPLEASYLVNAAGLYADQIHEMVGGASFTITPSKGEYDLLDKSAGTLVHLSLIHISSPSLLLFPIFPVLFSLKSVLFLFLIFYYF